MEDAQAAGKVRVIGVSNFLIDDLESLMQDCRVKPMVNQILLHIGKTDSALLDFCKHEQIQVEAYSPLAHGEALKNPIITELAAKYGVSAAQLCFVITDTDFQTLLQMEELRDYGAYNIFPVFSGKPLA